MGSATRVDGYDLLAMDVMVNTLFDSTPAFGAAFDLDSDPQILTYDGRLIQSPLAITTSTLPETTVGSAYNSTLHVNGGTGPYTWEIPAGRPIEKVQDKWYGGYFEMRGHK